MPTSLAGLLSQGIRHLRDGGTADGFLQQPDLGGLSDSDRAELTSLLEQAAVLLSLGKLPVPPPASKMANRARFLSAAVEQKEEKRVGRAGRRILPRRGGMEYLPRRGGMEYLRPRLLRGILGATLALVLVMFAGLGAVSASVDSLPGTPLYRLKLAAEDVRLTIARTGPARMRLYTRFAGERGTEMMRLSQAGEDIDEAVVERMAQQWKAAVQTAEVEKYPTSHDLLRQIVAASSSQGEALRQASAGAPPQPATVLNLGASIAEQTASQAEEALQHLTTPVAVPTSTPTTIATRTLTRTISALVAPVASATQTPTPTATATSSPTALPATPAVRLTVTPTVTRTTIRSATPSATPSVAPTSVPPTQPAPPTSVPSTTNSAVPPTATNTLRPTETPQAKFSLTLTDNPDPVPATHRIHYVVCVVNEGDVPLTHVVLKDTWSPRECVYYLPLNPEELLWTFDTVAPRSQSCEAFALYTYSTCGGITAVNQATMSCDQGTVSIIERTRIGPTPSPTETPTPTDTPTPTVTLTPTDTPTPTVIPTPTDTPTPAVTDTASETPTLAETLAPTETPEPTPSPTNS